MEYLFVISGVFSALFSFLLLSKKKKDPEHWFLVGIFVLITINSLYVFNFYSHEDFYYVPYFSEFNYAIPLLYPVLLWLYSRALINVEFKLKLKDNIHITPFVIFLSILLSPLLTNYSLLASKHVGYPLIKLIITPFYLFAVLLLLKKYRIRLKDQFSFDHKMKLLWLSWITVGAIALWIIALGGYIYNSLHTGHKSLLYDYYVLSFLALYLFILAFVAFKHTDIFQKRREEDIPAKLEEEEIEIELTNRENFENEDLKRLLEIMSGKKPFLDPLLSINKLADITHLPQYKISKILNTSLNQNFYDFVNTYRINEVKMKLSEGEAHNYSILGIASECGFNSKASFNRVFKKISGMTPSEYLREVSK